MIDFIKNIFKPKLEPLNYIVVNNSNILNNINVLQNLQEGSFIFPVLKSNAYWHWLKGICQIINKSNLKAVCVDSFLEYQFIKKYTDKDIIILWETINKNYLFYNFSRVIFCVYNIETISYLVSLNKKIKIHLFLNTWMNREGIKQGNLKDILFIIKKSNLILDWVCIHFSSSDEISFETSQKQIDKFKEYYKIVKSYWLNPIYRHIWASSGILKLNDNFFNAFRHWLSFYWYNPLIAKDEFYNNWEKLKPALDLYCKIVSIHHVKSWEGVGYNLTYKFKWKSRVATIAFWYQEWLDRRFSNNLKIKCKNNYYPICWRISMNLCNFEIWEDNLQTWDTVQVISSNPRDLNSISNLSKKIWTIDYEILTWLNPSIRRTFL